MNLNEDVINKNRVQNRTILNKTAINRKTQFGMLSYFCSYCNTY